MVNQKVFGWVLVLVSLLLLVLTRRLDLLAILVPGAALMSVAAVGVGKTGQTRGSKKG